MVKASVLYFALVFAAGFAFGTIRVLLVVSRLGERTAELMEAPAMIAISYFAARWVVRRFALPPAPVKRLAVGLIALALMLAFEFGFVLPLRGLTIAEYFATRDPVSGTVYCISLALFALFPLLVRRPDPCR
ncbi:MAG: hypothetical protein HY316_09030 [Acidobacteria bacterium]|nr:hypothetical protein [Acidobacteriota bacterium]